MEPQEFINTQQLSNTQYNNLNKILYNSFFKNSLNNDYETNNFIELIQQIKSNNYSSTHNTITEFNNKKEIQELVDKKSQEINKNLSQELKQLKDKFNILQDSEQSKSREINSLQLDNQSNENNYNKQIKNLSEQHQNEIRKYEEQKQILKDKNDNLQQEKYEYAENEKQKFTLFHEKVTNQLNNTISYERNKIEQINKLFFTKLQEKDNIILDKDNKINGLQEQTSILNKSQKKGEIGEQFTQDNYVPYGWNATLISKTKNSGDHIFSNPNTNNKLCVDSKYYTNNVPSTDVDKLKNDVFNTKTDAGIIISLTSGISWEGKPLKSIDFRFISNKPFLFISNSTNLSHNTIKDLISTIDLISYSLKDNNNSSYLQTKISITIQNLYQQIDEIDSFKDILNKQKNSYISYYDRLNNKINRLNKNLQDTIQDIKKDISINYNDNLLNDIMLKSPESGFSTNEIHLMQQTIRNISFNNQQNNSEENNSEENNSEENNSEENNLLFFQELFQKTKNYNDINDFKKNMYVIFKYHQKILKGKVFNIKDVNIEIIQEKTFSKITRHINNHEIRILPD